MIGVDIDFKTDTNKYFTVSYLRGNRKEYCSLKIPIDRLKGFSESDLDLIVTWLTVNYDSLMYLCKLTVTDSIQTSLDRFNSEFISVICKVRDIELLNAIDNERQQILNGKKESYNVAKKHPIIIQKRSISGCVYLLKAGKYYKIGASKDINGRLRKLSTLPPFDLELVHKIITSNMYRLENELHNIFADKRVNGEWFLLTDNDVELIKEL